MRARPLVFVFVIFSLFSSCRKSVYGTGNTGLILGKWFLKEVYEGYTDGGDFQWHAVAPQQGQLLAFDSLRQFTLLENPASSNQQCFGTYSLNNDVLSTYTSCNRDTIRYGVSQLSSNALVIDRQVQEGVIKYRYGR